MTRRASKGGVAFIAILILAVSKSGFDSMGGGRRGVGAMKNCVALELGTPHAAMHIGQIEWNLKW